MLFNRFLVKVMNMKIEKSNVMVASANAIILLNIKLGPLP